MPDTTVRIDSKTHRTTIKTGPLTTVYGRGHTAAGQIGLLHDEILRLRAIVDRLPKTADGVPVVPGMRVYVSADVAGYWGQKPGKAVEFMVDWIRSQATPVHLVFVRGQTYQILADRVYSTREAAEAAKEDGNV